MNGFMQRKKNNLIEKQTVELEEFWILRKKQRKKMSEEIDLLKEKVSEEVELETKKIKIRKNNF